jgi:putative nucleotidyltransferase with HDIG domain
LSPGRRALGSLARWALLLPPALAAGLPHLRLPTVLLHGFLLSFFWLLLRFYRRESFAEYRQLGFFSALFTVTLGLAAVLSRLWPGWPALAPVPMAALLVSLLYNGRLAMVAAAVLTLVLATPGQALSLGALTFGLGGGVAAGLSLRRVRRRSEQYRAVVAIAGGNLVGAVVLGLAAPLPVAEAVRQGAMGVGMAVADVAVAMLLLPAAEAWSRRTTDFTLLELADPTQPLLTRLAREAPGTWAHSLVVANLGEAGCNAIGANGLLARVGGYYHDVGKLTAPEWFVENQDASGNPLAQLSPRESALRVREHVTGGLAIAGEAGLPDEVRRFIPEHHGTMRLDYFLAQLDPADRAAAAAEEEFRYPGPRPRTRETAVAMLADAAEAAVRVLEDRSPERVGEVVHHLIHQRVLAGQLAEAPVTLPELDQVADAFIPLLAGLHHGRLDYPRSTGGITKDFGNTAG